MFILVEGRALPRLVGRWAGAGALRVPSLRVHFSVAPVHAHRHTAEARVFFLNGSHFLTPGTQGALPSSRGLWTRRALHLPSAFSVGFTLVWLLQ